MIDDITIFNDGVRVQAKLSTDILDEIIDDIIENGSDLFIAFGEQRPVRNYFSALIFEIEVEEQPNGLSILSNKLNTLVANYGSIREEFRPFAIHLWANQHAPSGPTLLKIERVVDLPDNPKAFFSSGPLRTEDHLEILREFEKIVG